MSNTPLQGAQELLCINANKVYDWVILQANVNQTVLAADLGTLAIDPCDPVVTNLTTDCFLVDAFGTPLTPNSIIPVTEVGERQDRTFVVDGALVTLQRVTFIKTLHVVVEFSGLSGTTPFVEQTAPITVEIPETLFLCAPEGTDLLVRLSDIDCSVRVNCSAEALTSIDLILSLCQGVQSVTNVTLELTAEFCSPREILTEQCPAPLIPAQCPVVFPG